MKKNMLIMMVLAMVAAPVFAGGNSNNSSETNNTNVDYDYTEVVTEVNDNDCNGVLNCSNVDLTVDDSTDYRYVNNGVVVDGGLLGDLGNVNGTAAVSVQLNTNTVQNATVNVNGYADRVDATSVGNAADAVARDGAVAGVGQVNVQTSQNATVNVQGHSAVETNATAIGNSVSVKAVGSSVVPH